MRRLSFLALLAILAYPISAIGQVTEAEIDSYFVLQDVLAGINNGQAMDAQTALDEIKSGLLGLNSTELSMLDGFSLTDQGNVSLVRQDGFDNLVEISQSGDANLSVVIQEGSGLETRTAQTGTGNVIGVRLVGHDLVMQSTDGSNTVIQDGHQNVYLLEFEGSDMQIPVSTQVGVDNQVVQLGQIGTPFGVEQRGNGLRMTIIHNGVE